MWCHTTVLPVAAYGRSAHCSDTARGEEWDGGMTTKIELIVAELENPEAFDAQLPALLEEARALPGLQRLESGRVWPKEDGTPRPAHRTLALYFAGYEEASAATASPEGVAFFPAFIGSAGGGVTGLFTDVED